MSNSPIQLFRQWYDLESKRTSVRIPSACCLSTNGIDGFPNARFVSLKDIINDDFVITGPLTSRKGVEIEHSEKVSLSFWWPETERQVRVQGNASIITKQMADKYFSERNRDSQIVSVVSLQGDELLGNEDLIRKYNEVDLANVGIAIHRPENWGGFRIEPIRIEFLEFKPTRFHKRTLFEWIDLEWRSKNIQP